MVRPSIRQWAALTAIALTLSACASRGEYGNLGDAGVAYSQAVAAFSDEAARVQVDSTSWYLIGQLQTDPETTLTEVEQAIASCDDAGGTDPCRGVAIDLQTDVEILQRLANVSATARGIGRYFSAVSAIANSTASAELKASVIQAGGNLQSLLTAVNGSEANPQYNDLAGTLADLAGDAVVTAYLRREIDNNYDFLIAVFELQSTTVNDMVRDMNVYAASASINRNDALLRLVTQNPDLANSLQETSEWVDARRSALLSPLSLESATNLQNAQRRLSRAFEALASTTITPERLAALEAAFAKLAEAISATTGALQSQS